MDRRILISLMIVAGGYASFWLLHAGFHTAPNALRGADLGELKSFTSCAGQTRPLPTDTTPQWRIQSFHQVDSTQIPSRITSTCTFKITTTTGTYNGLYHPESTYAYLNFSPRYTHGWFRTDNGNTVSPFYRIKAEAWLRDTFELPTVEVTAEVTAEVFTK